MKAVATDGRCGLEVVEVAEPALPAGGGRVRVVACGVCGSDLEKILAPRLPAGRVLGHEVVGLLERPGFPSQRVALAHHVPCGHCERCLRGHSSLCEQFVATDLVPGGFSEGLAVSSLHLADAVFPLPDSVDNLTGTLLEPLSCVLRALDTAAGLLPAYPLPGVAGDAPAAARAAARTEVRWTGRPRVLVAGCGVVGLLFVSVLRLAAASSRTGAPDGAARVPYVRPDGLFFLETRPERARLAERLGARQLPAEQVAGHEAPHLAFVTAPGALDRVIEVMEPGGVVVIFAAPPEPIPLDLDSVYRRELTLAAVRSGSPEHLRAALSLLAENRLELGWLEPEVVGLEGLPAALGRYARGEVLKVVVRP